VLPQWRAIGGPVVGLGPITWCCRPARGGAGLQPNAPAHGRELGLAFRSDPAWRLLACSGPCGRTTRQPLRGVPLPHGGEGAAVFPDTCPRASPRALASMAGLASTVLRWGADDHWRVLRGGAVMQRVGLVRSSLE